MGLQCQDIWYRCLWPLLIVVLTFCCSGKLLWSVKKLFWNCGLTCTNELQHLATPDPLFDHIFSQHLCKFELLMFNSSKGQISLYFTGIPLWLVLWILHYGNTQYFINGCIYLLCKRRHPILGQVLGDTSKHQWSTRCFQWLITLIVKVLSFDGTPHYKGSSLMWDILILLEIRFLFYQISRFVSTCYYVAVKMCPKLPISVPFVELWRKLYIFSEIKAICFRIRLSVSSILYINCSLVHKVVIVCLL